MSTRREDEVDALLALAEEEREKWAGIWEYDPVLLWHCRLDQRPVLASDKLVR
jgi:hypothetical protein